MRRVSRSLISSALKRVMASTKTARSSSRPASSSSERLFGVLRNAVEHLDVIGSQARGTGGSRSDRGSATGCFRGPRVWRDARDAVLDMKHACDEVLAFAASPDGLPPLPYGAGRREE